MTIGTNVESLLRELSPRVTGLLARRYGCWERCEDAVQEALVAASRQWRRDGIPVNPQGWLISVAARRWIEQQRSDDARTRRERVVARLEVRGPATTAADDTLTLLLLCCHPALLRPSQVALTLRAVGGLTTAEIARAYLVPEATIGQRISRAKQKIRAAGAQFRLPAAHEIEDRVVSVCNVLYLIFNEGYTATSGPELQRVDLTTEAIRLARQLHRLLPDHGEVTGLLALLLLTDARRPARVAADGGLIPLRDQDRSLWSQELIQEGKDLITQALSTSRIGPYQVQAAIAAVHDEALHVDDTDWRQVLVLYDLLHALAPGPMVALGRIVALAMVHGAECALDELLIAEQTSALSNHHRLSAVRAHLLELAGRPQEARDAYALAARHTRSEPEQRYLTARRDQLEERRTG